MRKRLSTWYLRLICRQLTKLLLSLSSLGQSVILHCYIDQQLLSLQQSQENQVVVSWFRGSGELQLLTHENMTIIPDERFRIRNILLPHHQSAQQQLIDWPLQIKNLDKATDSGLYQCQTNTEPPISQYYQLNIVEPHVTILNSPDLAVKINSQINLTCLITQTQDQTQYIFWYRDGKMLNYDLDTIGGKIVLTRSSSSSYLRNSIDNLAEPDTITSNLIIYNAKLPDSGNYTCMPSGAKATSIYVHVLEGKLMEMSKFDIQFLRKKIKPISIKKLSLLMDFLIDCTSIN